MTAYRRAFPDSKFDRWRAEFRVTAYAASSPSIERQVTRIRWHAWTMSREVCRRPDEIDKGPKRSGQQAPTWIVKKRAREGLPPRFKDGLQCTAVQMRAQPIFK